MSQLTMLSVALGAALQQKGWQLALAESCTGGLIAQAVTDVVGSSAWFDRGFVTYSNAAKMDMLGVPESLIMAHGAVSTQVAAAMAEGALEHSLSQLTGAVTGIAGPGGGSALKPVGTVCFAWARRPHAGLGPLLVTEICQFEGGRQQVREQAACHLLAHLLRIVEARA